jgi:hypothetical protein
MARTRDRIAEAPYAWRCRTPRCKHRGVMEYITLAGEYLHYRQHQCTVCGKFMRAEQLSNIDKKALKASLGSLLWLNKYQFGSEEAPKDFPGRTQRIALLRRLIEGQRNKTA